MARWSRGLRALVWCGCLVVVGASGAAGCSNSKSGEVGDGDGDGGAGESCTPDAAECVTDRLARVCPADGSRWVSFACPTGETCTDGACSSGEPCMAGATECVSDEVARICPNDGSAWLPLPCGLGERCMDGQCRLVTSTDGGVVGDVCTPGEQLCATSKIVKICETSGAGFVSVGCAEDERCENGDCVLDTDSGVCEPGERRCLDDATALTCTDTGAGFTTTDCPTGTSCIDGLCSGSACVVDESQCDGGNRLQICRDGQSWVLSRCDTGEVCLEENEDGFRSAQCVPAVCSINTTVCGDPDDPATDPTSFYSRCERLTDDTIGWIRYECTAPESCDPSFFSAGCSRQCTPGAKRCTGDRNGVETCTDQGEWGPEESCNPGVDAQRRCMGVPNQPVGALADVVCAEPVCYDLFLVRGQDEGGVCEGDQIRLCGDDGNLAATATDCAAGMCQPLTTIRAGGYLPATCTTECEDGEQRCVGTTTPLYQRCAGGTWSTTADACPNGELCYDYTLDGLTTVLCGGECIPGTRRCTSSLEIETCNAQGQFDPAEACTVGECRSVSGDAACVLECVPGETVCMGSSKLASDGYTSGLDQEGTCTPEGLLPTTGTACPGTTTCRETRTDHVLGCVECIGVDAPGGNALGLADTRCAPTGNGTQFCNSSNLWSMTTDCAAGETCVDGATTVQTCSSCSGVTPCTESGIMTTYGSTFDCSSVAGGTPMSCGGVPDCCSFFCASSGLGPPAAYCEP